MSSSRKPLAVALAVVMLLAMLVPAALAAPEWAHGITVSSPTSKGTTPGPVYVNPEKVTALLDSDGNPLPDKSGDHWFTINYNVPIVGTQVDDVRVTFTLLNKTEIPSDLEGFVVLQNSVVIPAAKLPSSGGFSYQFEVIDSDSPLNGEVPDGWYDLKVCAKDIDPARDEFCTDIINAVLVQDTSPTVDLEKPGIENYHGATFVTGKAYQLVGTAADAWGIDKVVFQYCDMSNGNGCRWNDAGWITIASNKATPATATPTANVPGQWEALWDSTAVPDDLGRVRMCVWNFVGLSNCAPGPDEGQNARQDAHLVWVTNYFTMDLEPGWNLISLPLMPYDSSISNVLFHLLQHKTVKQVYSFAPGPLLWTPPCSPTPCTSGPQQFTTMVDGRGYWIQMAAEDNLTVAGTYLAFPPNTPPEYSVAVGWNLIGYTQWGQPWWLPSSLAADYLDGAANVQALWMYDADYEVFVQQDMLDPMVVGKGLWLASTSAGTIRPR